MFKRAVNFLRTVPRYLLLAGLALVLGLLILVADVVFDRPSEPISIGKLLGISSSNSGLIYHDYTFSGLWGRYGLMDVYEFPAEERVTTIVFSDIWYDVHFSIYAVVGAGNCFLLAGTFTTLWLLKRKRPPAA